MESKKGVHSDEAKQSSNNSPENSQRMASKEKIPESYASGSVEEKLSLKPPKLSLAS